MKQFPVVLVYPDSNINAGYGHVSRCLTLANDLCIRRCNVYLLLNKQYQFKTHPDLQILYNVDPNLGEIIKNVKPDIIVFDGIGFELKWASLKNCHSISSVIIDDLGNLDVDFDLVINPNVYTLPNNYKSTSLIGPSYALLRPEITQANSNYKVRSKIKQITVCMGGGDPNNINIKIFNILESSKIINDDVIINFVLGPFATQTLSKALTKKKNHSRLNIRIFNNPREFTQILLETDVAVVSGGVIATECACIGVPALAVSLADNQESALKAWSERKALFMSEPLPGILDRDLGSLISDKSLRVELSYNGQSLVDGLGVGRVSEAILDL